MRSLLLFFALVGAPLGAQPLRPGLLLGRILGPDGAPIADAVLRATQGARTILAESDKDGDYRVGGLGTGTWTVSVRRLGWQALAVDVQVPAEGLRRDFALQPQAVVLDPQLVAARWTGVRGLVGDARRIAPLAGATVRLLGSDASAGTDSLGSFALAIPGDRIVLLRVERAGYASRVISLRLPHDAYIPLEVALDSSDAPPRDVRVWRDLDQRLKFATPRAALVGRDEIGASDAISLATALHFAPTIQRLNLTLSRRACLYVDGVPRPGVPVDAIRASEVEFVEAYPPGSDLTRTLAMRWPARATCGAPEGTSAPAASAAARNVIQFVSVWMRAP